MFDTGAVLVIVVFAALQPLQNGEGWAARSLNLPTATVRQFNTKAQCESAAENWLNDLEEVPLNGRTAKVFCIVP